MNFWNGVWNWWVVHFLICVHQGRIVFLGCHASARAIAEHLRELKCCMLCKGGSLLLSAWSLETVETCSGLMSLACNWVLLYSLFLRTDFSVCSWRKENSYVLMCLRRGCKRNPLQPCWVGDWILQISIGFHLAWQKGETCSAHLTGVFPQGEWCSIKKGEKQADSGCH